jgi:DNA repair photolyase
MILKLAAIQMVKKAAGLMGKRLEDVVVRRRKAIKTMRKQLTINKPAGVDLQKKAVIYTSPLVDAAASMVLVRETAEACRMIFELTNWDVRVLSKSSFLDVLAKMIPDEFKMRMIYGFSTGTLDDKLCDSFEKGTARVTKRLKSLYWLQDNGYRTFGMLCPILPQRNYEEYADRAAKAIRVEQCEHVWGEVINVRGDSLVATCKALEKEGFTEEMERLNGVCGPGSGEAWEQYARAAFEGLANRMPPGKLRFLQYVKPETLDWWFPRKADGAVLLGSLMS